MKATEVHAQMLEFVRKQNETGRTMDVVSGTKTRLHVNGGRARCGSAILHVTPDGQTFILGGSSQATGWTREATAEEIAALPDTDGSRRLLGFAQDAWFGEP